MLMVVIISLGFCKFVIRRDGTDLKCSNAVMSLIYPSINLCNSVSTGVVSEKIVLACNL